MNTAQLPLNRVVVCVCTYKRPGLLTLLLPKLAEQIRALPSWNIRVVIVDNDERRSAESVVNEFAQEYDDIPVQYISEPAPGVGNARNAGFRAVRAREALVFFDDDQQPSPNWLAELLGGQKSFPSAILVGPVVPLLPKESPEWALGAWAWGRRELPDGLSRKQAGFGNILIPPNVSASGLCHVPTEFLRGMGEDTLVTTTLTNAGFLIRQVAAAKAYEPVTSERLSVEWVSERARISGETWVRVVRASGGSSAKLAFSMLKILISLVVLKMRTIVSVDPTSKVKLIVTRSRLDGYIQSIFRS
ncbi:UNVERIFIED_ORG: glycosyltransferase involved in cell wall biosynthesis [Arthrobacter sp. UYEF2]